MSCLFAKFLILFALICTITPVHLLQLTYLAMRTKYAFDLAVVYPRGSQTVTSASADIAVCPDTCSVADGHSAETCIGIAADSMPGHLHATAANPYLACVREQPNNKHNCYKNKMMLALVAVIIILAGAVLGLGLYFGMSKGPCGASQHIWGLATIEPLYHIRQCLPACGRCAVQYLLNTPNCVCRLLFQ
jgi:hypothetical protein